MVDLTYDVDAVRRRFPALSRGVAHFDGAGGTLVPGSVGAAIARTLTSDIANRGDITEAARRADGIVVAARRSMADLLGCAPAGVVFGRSMTQLTYDMARALARTWRPGDEIVVSRLDHDANIRPWVQVAGAAGATVRWADFDPDTAELDPARVAAELTGRTRLVAVTGASNLLGTRPDIPEIAAAAHSAGALLYVDGVHLTPHVPVDIGALGADFFACSPYKFCGPHLGAVAAAPELLETLHPDKLAPATEAVPERFELGTLPYELLAGTTAAVEFLSDLSGGTSDTSGTGGTSGTSGTGGRRARLRAGMAALERYEEVLFARLAGGLRRIAGVRTYGRPARRTPTILFTLDGHHPDEVAKALEGMDINAPAGFFYALEPARRLGLEATGAVRASLAPYSNEDDVDRLLTAVATLR